MPRGTSLRSTSVSDLLPDSTLSELDELVRLPSASRAHLKDLAAGICTSLEREPTVRQSSVAGSVARETAIREFSDLDIVVQMEPNQELEHASPKETLVRLAQVVEKLGSYTEVGQRVVTVHFADKVSADILPVLLSTTGPLAPNVAGDEWEPTEVLEIEQTLQSDQCDPERKLAQIVRLLKSWNMKRRIGLVSVEIEVAVHLSWEGLCVTTGQHRNIDLLEAVLATLKSIVRNSDSGFSSNSLPRRSPQEIIDVTSSIGELERNIARIRENHAYDSETDAARTWTAIL